MGIYSVGRRVATGMLFVLTLSSAYAADDYPSHPLRIVVPNSGGTIPDAVARIMAEGMSKELGQTVYVENKPGGAQIIGYEFAANSEPDGYTLVSTLSSELALLPLLNKSLRFDPWKDLPPLVGIGEATLMVGTSSESKWNTLKEMMDYGKAHPGELNFGSSSPGIRLPMIALLKHYGVDAVDIQYKGGAPFQTALISNEVDIGFMPEASALTHGDRYRALAVTSPKRLPTFPDAPTFAELGVPNIPSNSYSLNVPKGLPDDVETKLRTAISDTLKDPTVRKRLEQMHLQINERSSEEAQKLLEQHIKIYSDMAKRAGLKPQ